MVMAEIEGEGVCDKVSERDERCGLLLPANIIHNVFTMRRKRERYVWGLGLLTCEAWAARADSSSSRRSWRRGVAGILIINKKENMVNIKTRHTKCGNKKHQ